jgi:DNA-binding transcriptional LysR family regulator
VTDFRTLEAIVWISRLGGFSAAAERMNTTQPAISHRIQQLEQQLGVRLVQRQKPRVVLTDKGRDLLRFAERILQMREQALTTVARPDSLERRLSLGVVETIARSWLPEFLKRATAIYPRVEFEINVDDSPSLRSRLLSYDLDLAILSGTVEDPVIRSLPLSRSKMSFVCSPSPDVKTRMTADDLAKRPIITFARTSSMRPVLDTLFSDPELPHHQLHTSNSLSTIVQMARDGIGIAFIPLIAVASDIADGFLVELDTVFDTPHIAFSACWLSTPDRILVALVAELAAEIATGT